MSAGRGFLSGKALLAVALWGGSLPAIRIALESFHPVGLVATRMVAGAALLLLLARARAGRALPATRDLPIGVFLGAVLGFHMLIQTYGLSHTSAINTGWIIGFTPVAIALGAQLFLRKGLTAAGWAGVAIATAGVLSVTVSEPPDFARARLGHAIAFATTLTWATYTLAATGAVGRSGSLPVTAFSAAVAAALLLVASLWSGILVAPLTAQVAGAWLFLSLLCSGLAYLLWYQALEERGPTATGVMLYFEPFFTLAVSVVLLREVLTLAALAGGLAVFAGVWIVGVARR